MSAKNRVIHIVSCQEPPVGAKLTLIRRFSEGKDFDVEAVKCPENQNGGLVSGLQWKLEDGSFLPMKKNDCWAFHESAEILIKMDNELHEMSYRGNQYRMMASFLGDCSAATAEDVGSRKSSSKYERERQADICDSIVRMLSCEEFIGLDLSNRYSSEEGIDGVVNRCREAAVLCRGKGK